MIFGGAARHAPGAGRLRTPPACRARARPPTSRCSSRAGPGSPACHGHQQAREATIAQRQEGGSGARRKQTAQEPAGIVADGSARRRTRFAWASRPARSALGGGPRARRSRACSKVARSCWKRAVARHVSSGGYREAVRLAVSRAPGRRAARRAESPRRGSRWCRPASSGRRRVAFVGQALEDRDPRAAAARGSLVHCARFRPERSWRPRRQLALRGWRHYSHRARTPRPGPWAG